MKKITQLLLVTFMFLSSLTWVQANGFDEYYYANELDNYPYLNNVIHASSYDLPKQYDSRNKGLVTSVKNQGSYETHWLHAFMGASESNILKKGLAASSEQLNLSELAAGYVVYHNKPTDTNLTSNDSSTSALDDFLYGDGHLEGTAFMIGRGGGITSESTLPYSMASSDELSYYLNGNTMLWADYRLKDAIFISRNDEDAIKEAIIKYGAVAIKYQSCRINDPKQAYVYRSGGTINSALTIIGYDDTISKDLFYGETPSRDGAWLVKNSWGNTANGGIFYLSYDHMMQDAVAYIYAPTEYYDHNYHYDATPSMTMTSQQPNIPLKAANVYRAQKGTSSKPEYLRSVGVGIGSVHTNYEIQIYTNLTDESNPESGIAVFDAPISGSKNHPGYYSIDLPQPVLLAKDTLFSIVVTLRNRNQRHLTYIYTSESTRFGDYVNFVEGTSNNQSFFYENGEWIDLHSQQKVARIRALTTTKTSYSTTTLLDTSQFTLTQDKYVYTGAAIEPEVQCLNNQYQEGRDYTIVYENNILSGDAKVTIHGINAYTGMIELPFTISKRQLLASMVDDIPSQISYGTPLQPQERVLLKNRVLQKGIDYEVTYGENLSKKGTVVITGKGQFEGTVTKEFVIKGLDEMCYFQAIVEPADAGSASIRSSGFAGESINAVTGPYSSDYIFVYWLKDGKVFARENPLSFIAQESATLVAQYRPTKEYADLQDLYIQLKDTENDSYSEQTWNQFQADLELAEYIVSKYMINDERLGACYYWLSDSYAALSKEDIEPEPKINYDEAKVYLDEMEAKKLSENKYTPNSWDVFETAYQQLENMVALENATSQEELNTTLNCLKKAYDMLKLSANMSQLNNLYQQWNTYLEEDYTKTSWSLLQSNKQLVEAMLQNKNATQEEVDALYEQIKDLTLIPKGNTLALQTLVQEYRMLDASIFTVNSYTCFKMILDEVQECLEDTDDLTQDDVELYELQLTTAYKQLVKIVGKVENFTTSIINYKEVKLTWDDVAEADVYIVQRLSKEGVWEQVAEVRGCEYIYTQKTGVKYVYRILAKRISDGYVSEPSDIQEATTQLNGVPVLSIAPYSSTRLTLSWTKVEGATRYIIYRKVEGGSYSKVLTLGGSDTSYTTNSLTPNQYYFIVKAARYDSTDRVMTNGSNEVEGVSVFDKPVVRVSKESDSTALISWDKVEGANGYEVYRKTGSQSSYKKLKTLKECSYISKSLKMNEAYYYKVRGFKKEGNKKVYTAYSTAKTLRMK